MLEVPIYDRHTGANMFNIVAKLRSSLYGEAWTDKLTGVATDCANIMLERLCGSFTRIASEFRGTIHRIW